MPIRLNLLAEAQAAEELRRRDPVKRCIWIGGLLVALVLVWSSSLQLKAMMAKRVLSRVEGQMNALTNTYALVQANMQKVQDVHDHILALHRMTTNRFLQANLLNALQLTTVDDVSLIHYRIDQTYAMTDEVKARTNDTRVIPGRPATITEKIAFSLDGNDTSVNPGDMVSKYKEVLASNSYLHDRLSRTNPVSLKSLSAPEFSPSSGKRGVYFTLDCRFPDNTR